MLNSDYSLLTDVEYTFVDQKKNWSEAELHCKSLGHGFTLAIVDSDATRDAIAAVAQDHVWIGLKGEIHIHMRYEATRLKQHRLVASASIAFK